MEILIMKSQLLDIRIGPGAAILPNLTSSTREHSPVTRLHLTYASKIYNGHQGARHFWRNCLQRLKYHNPSIPITVKQTDEQDGPAALTIYFAGKIGTKAAEVHAASIQDKYAPTALSTEKSIVIDAKGLDYTEIWKRVKNATGAEDLSATTEELAEVEKYNKMDERSKVDAVRVAAIRQAKKDQERMLQEARGEVEKLKQ